MHPLTPVSEQERQAQIVGGTTPTGGWGALVALVALVAVLALVILFLSGSDAEQSPVEPVPSEVPVDPGS